jgi:hypothetical protein
MTDNYRTLFGAPTGAKADGPDHSLGCACGLCARDPSTVVMSWRRAVLMHITADQQ